MTQSPFPFRTRDADTAALAARVEREKAYSQHAQVLLPDVTSELVAFVEQPQGAVVFLNRAGRTLLGFADNTVLDDYAFADFVPKRARAKLWQALSTCAEASDTWTGETELRRIDGKICYVALTALRRDSGDGLPGGLWLIARDLTPVADLQHRLVETSKLAGMAEVSSGVLHNIGNAFNSVNTSATLVADRLAQSRLSNLARAVKLFEDHAADLPQFLSCDVRGKQLPAYLRQLSDHLLNEHQMLLREAESLRKSVDHIKTLIGMQQGYAHASILAENLVASELLEEAVLISEASLSRHRITAVRNFQAVPPVYAARHKVLQILVNLIRNAKHALDESNNDERRLELTIRSENPGYVQLIVADNGVGIPAENLQKIFSFGFTTKKTGHGFGLHSSAVAAEEMQGSLRAESGGAGKGARFILELPTQNSSALS